MSLPEGESLAGVVDELSVGEVSESLGETDELLEGPEGELLVGVEG